jgi:hypothetical protein
LSYRRAQEAAPFRGAAPMTVCTNDIALCNLAEHVIPIAISDAGRDCELLVPEVVELKHDGIGLSAIDAGVVSEVRHQEDQPFLELRFLPPCRSVDVALFVGPVMLLLVLGPTGPTIGISPSSPSPVPREFLVPLLLAATRASPHEASI